MFKQLAVYFFSTRLFLIHFATVILNHYSMKTSLITLPLAAILLAVSCDRTLDEQSVEASQSAASLKEVALMLSSLPLGREQMEEVHTAVMSSSGNGYDEEYTMKDLFDSPGSGVGDQVLGTKAGQDFRQPMRDLIRQYLSDKHKTKAGEDNPAAVEQYIKDMIDSDIQIYWPFSDNWNGRETPVITFNPGTDAEANIGYTLEGDEVEVSEAVARERPVWVVNINDDSAYTTYEMLLQQYPGWGQGGDIYVGTKADDTADIKALRMKDFKMNRNYDSWFCGASEFFVKCGLVENFKANDEDELRNYVPSIIDFMVVVKRRQLNQKIPFNVLLASEWTEQMEDIAFMISEDDGGTITSWKVDCTVKIKSKTYGIEIDLPIRSRDDIVWRGSLSRRYIQNNSGKVQHFGDVEMTLELI